VGSAWIFGREGRPNTGALARSGCGFGLALLAAALVWPAPTVGDMSQSGELAMSASGEITPIKLPRSKAAPASLRLGFTSEALNSPVTPELSRIAFEISPNVELHTAGLRSCSFAELYSSTASLGHSCVKSLVGHGIVDSEITLPGRSPAQVEGHLLAFYVFREGERRILARVRTGAPLPLIYVIPFKITSERGAFGTSLTVRRMRIITGVCIHPNCFSPYTLKGVYGHISRLELSLHRRFAHARERDSFISTRCPTQGKTSEATFPVMRASLDYTSGDSLAATVNRKCRVDR
jgi:hypothetical protein